MPKRNPLRDKAYEIWKASRGKKLLKDIAAELGVSPSRIRKWKCEDNWTLKKRRRSFKRSFNNGVNNEGVNSDTDRSAVLRLRNQNAFKTGEYATIWLDTLDEVELSLYHSIETESLLAINEDIKLLTIRERRILKLLNELKSKAEDIRITNIYEYEPYKSKVDVYDSATDKFEQAETTKYEKILKKTVEEKQDLTNKIIDIENALTRVQEKKLRAIDSRERILSTQKQIELKEQQLKQEMW